MKANINTETGRKAIEAELETVQKRCTARTLTLFKIATICDTVGRELGISKKALAGTTIHYTGAEHFPRAYKFTPDSTQFRATFSGRDWVVTAIWRGTCPNKATNTETVISETAWAAIKERLSNLSI